MGRWIGRTVAGSAAATTAIVLAAQSLAAAGPGSWTSTRSLNVARAGYVMNSLPDGRALVSGGLNGGTSTEIYAPATRTWARGADMSAARSRSASVSLVDGRVLIAGGRDGATSLASAEVYDPATGRWTPTGSMSSPRDWLSMTRLADGRALVAGGLDLDMRPANPVLQSAEIFDPATGTWTQTGAMNTKRWGFTLVTLPDGRVLAAGGANAGSECQFSPTSEVFDPHTGRWTYAGDMSDHRGFYRAILVAGRALFIGGEVASAGQQCAVTTSSVEAFDPATGAFTSLGPLLGDRAGEGVAPLPDGRLLVAGGVRMESTGAAALSSCEIYDPRTAQSVASAMLAPRAQILGLALPDGSVLVPGGTQLNGVFRSDSATFVE
jgi:Kelch motif